MPPAGILPISVPDMASKVIDSPPSAPKIEAVDQWYHDLHRGHASYPGPRSYPGHSPACALGKRKKLIFDMLEAKAAAETGQQCQQPEIPRAAYLYPGGNAGTDTGRYQKRCQKAMALRPHNLMKKPEGMRRVAPVRPDGGKGNNSTAQRKTQIEHLHRQYAPLHPDPETRQQARYGDPTDCEWPHPCRYCSRTPCLPRSKFQI